MPVVVPASGPGGGWGRSPWDQGRAPPGEDQSGGPAEIDDLFAKDLALSHTSQRIRQILDRKREREIGGWPPVRRFLHIMFHKPFSLRARVYMAFSTAVLLLFLIVFMIDTMPQYRVREDWRRLADLVNLTTSSVFAAEWVLRFYAYPRPLRYLIQPLTLLDVLGIFPGFIPYRSGRHGYLGQLKWLRALQILRVLRVLRLASYSVELYVTMRTMRKSLVQIMIVMIVILVAMLTACFLLFFAENDALDTARVEWLRKNRGVSEVSPFQNVFFCLYWGFVTITTVGYGDYTPVSPWGQVIACFTMFVGVFTIVFPTSIISNNFAAEWAAFQAARRLEEERDLRDRNQAGRHELHCLYSYAAMPYKGNDGNSSSSTSEHPSSTSPGPEESQAECPSPDPSPAPPAPLPSAHQVLQDPGPGEYGGGRLGGVSVRTGPQEYAQIIDVMRRVEKDLGVPNMALGGTEVSGAVNQSLLIGALHSRLYNKALTALCERMALVVLEGAEDPTLDAVVEALQQRPATDSGVRARIHGRRLTTLEFNALEFVLAPHLPAEQPLPPQEAAPAAAGEKRGGMGRASTHASIWAHHRPGQRARQRLRARLHGAANRLSLSRTGTQASSFGVDSPLPLRLSSTTPTGPRMVAVSVASSSSDDSGGGT
ncbi:hypothetical protein H4R18_004573 [Coemansia javaensis]|uniref:Ion transport domain-containing protein n=1 Tax=Coemansia javaensis TaxID=2761396 RepID=A0A9W8HBU3_9FUNG|nr:hypothetical protein H4R18_004573 [Coemansia javaensis]